MPWQFARAELQFVGMIVIIVGTFVALSILLAALAVAVGMYAKCRAWR